MIADTALVYRKVRWVVSAAHVNTSAALALLCKCHLILQQVSEKAGYQSTARPSGAMLRYILSMLQMHASCHSNHGLANSASALCNAVDWLFHGKGSLA